MGLVLKANCGTNKNYNIHIGFSNCIEAEENHHAIRSFNNKRYE